MPEGEFKQFLQEKGVCIIHLNTNDWVLRILKNLDPPELSQQGQNPLMCLLDFVKNELGAQTVLIEPYISTDWNAEYGTVYSRVFQKIPNRTQRLHFFRKRISKYSTIYKFDEKTKQSYLGYTVLRPLHNFRVGDTLLAPPCTLPSSNYNLVHCLETYEPNVFGTVLKVQAMPFIQQDTTAAVCAEADLWMIARYFNKKGITRRYRPSDITSMATASLKLGPPREGLCEIQMIDALSQMNLNPYLIRVQDAKEAQEVIYSCIESELPIIVGIPHHVFLVIGHDYKKTFNPQPGISLFSEAVESFIIHDDASGPYRILKPQATPVSLPSGNTINLLSLGSNKVDFLLIPLPHRVHMHYEDARNHSCIWLQNINNHVSVLFKKSPNIWSDNLLKNLVLRIYLRSSSTFKTDLLREETSLRDEKILAKYKSMDLPKYVWVVEMIRPVDFDNNSPYKRKVIGEIILDSTGSRFRPSETLLAFHLDGSMYLPQEGKLLVGRCGSYNGLQRRKVQAS